MENPYYASNVVARFEFTLVRVHEHYEGYGRELDLLSLSLGTAEVQFANGKRSH